MVRQMFIIIFSANVVVWQSYPYRLGHHITTWYYKSQLVCMHGEDEIIEQNRETNQRIVQSPSDSNFQTDMKKKTKLQIIFK